MWLIRSYIRLAYEKRPFPSCWGVATHPASREETAVLHTLPRPGSGRQTLPGTGHALLPARSDSPGPDPGVFADAVTRWRALERLREFRSRLYECLALPADALFELTDAILCPEGRQHVHTAACHCKGSSKTAPGWEYQFIAAIGHLRTAWAAFTDAARTTPATRTEQTIAQVKAVLRRLRAAGYGHRAAPLFIFDAGYSAAALTDGLLGCPAHILVRLAAGSVFYADTVTWAGKNGRPARRRPAVHCLEPAAFAAATGKGPRGRTKALPPNPEPDETLTLPDTPLYGTGRAQPSHVVPPLSHADRGWFPRRKHPPVPPATL